MKLHVVVGVIIKNGKILICQRPGHLHLGHRWEFPGGKIKEDEPILHALQREMYEEIGITVTKANHFYTTECQYPDTYVRLECFLVTKFMGSPQKMEGQPQMHWVDVECLPQYDFPEANYKIIDQLVKIITPLREDQVEEMTE